MRITLRSGPDTLVIYGREQGDRWRTWAVDHFVSRGWPKRRGLDEDHKTREAASDWMDAQAEDAELKGWQRVASGRRPAKPRFTEIAEAVSAEDISKGRRQ